MATLALAFNKIVNEDKTSMVIFFQVEIIFNKNKIHDVFESVYSTIISKIQRPLGKHLRWINDSVIDYTFSISKYNPLAGSSYIKLPKELDHQRKGLINV